MQNISVKDLSIDYFHSDPVAQQEFYSKAQELFDEHGCFVIKRIFSEIELEPIRQDIQRLIQLRMLWAGLLDEPSTDGITHFDDGYVSLNRLDKTHGDVLINACRHLIALNQLGVDPKLILLSKKLMATETVIASSLNTLRIHLPQDRKCLQPWHQDFPYVGDSEDALVYWIPLRDVNEENGCLLIAPGSHRLGVLPRYVSNSPNYQVSHAIDLSLVNQFTHVSVPIQEGDAIVFSTLLLHASSLNQGERARWAALVRHGNFEYPKAVTRSWPRCMAHMVSYEETHPEYVIRVP